MNRVNAVGLTVFIALMAVVIVLGLQFRGSGTAGKESSGQVFKCQVSGASSGNIVRVSGLNTSGTLDDTEAIQSAINMAGLRGGGTVTLPAGTLLVDGHLQLQSNVKLTGAGPATIVKAGPGFLAAQGAGGGYPLISTYGASNVTIADLTADQSGNTLDAALPERLAGYVVEGRNSTNVLVDGVDVENPFTYSIAMVGTTGFCIEHSKTTAATGVKYDQLDGIHILDSSSGQVIYNVVRAGEDGLVAHTIGRAVDNILYAANDVQAGSNSAGMQLAIGHYPIYDITVVDNNFHGSVFGIRTGYYSLQSGAFYNITIDHNHIYDLTRNQQSPSIDIGGYDGYGIIHDVSVQDNQTCNAGPIFLLNGSRNIVQRTAACPTESHVQG